MPNISLVGRMRSHLATAQPGGRLSADAPDEVYRPAQREANDTPEDTFTYRRDQSS